MKRTLLLLAFIFSAGCQRISAPVVISADENSEDGYRFEGGFLEKTRTAFEDLDSGGYRMLWSLGDEIGIFSFDMKETGNINVRATLQSGSAGSSRGVFIPETIMAPSWSGDYDIGVEMPRQQDETFLVYYPYKDKTDIDIDDRCIHSTLENRQIQQALGDRQIGRNGFCYDFATVHPGEKKIDFTLKSAMAYLRIRVGSTALEGFRLRSAYVRDANGTVPMTGEFIFDTENRQMIPVQGRTFPNATVSVQSADDSFCASNPAVSELYLTVFPGDYSKAELYADLGFVNSEGQVATILAKLDNVGLLPSGAVKLQELGEVGRDSCPTWYEPLDNRDFLGETAYGAQNTYIVEEGGSVTFDVKARGDLLKASEPKYYGIMLASNLLNENLLRMPDGVQAYETFPSRPVPADYRITVNCLSGTMASFGVVAIYDKDHNLLWSYMIWKHQPGDPVRSVSYPGTPDFMDRALGARRSIDAAIKSAKALEGAAYFNWGRKDPFPWKNQVPSHYQTQVGSGYGLQWSITHPNVKMQDAGEGNWYDSQRMDLWGATNGTTKETRLVKGHKTIYDPCPEGYRVPDYDALCVIDGNKVLAEIEFSSSDKRYALQHSPEVGHLALPCPFSDLSAFAIKKTDGSYDYWLYHGNLWADSGWSNATTDACKAGYCYWSNINQSVSKYRASIIRGWYNGAGTKWSFDYSDKMAGAYPVRCQKE